jgi:hypothetical protein
LERDGLNLGRVGSVVRELQSRNVVFPAFPSFLKEVGGGLVEIFRLAGSFDSANDEIFLAIQNVLFYFVVCFFIHECSDLVGDRVFAEPIREN